jgi:hypothetical protein
MGAVAALSVGVIAAGLAETARPPDRTLAACDRGDVQVCGRSNGAKSPPARRGQAFSSR